MKRLILLILIFSLPLPAFAQGIIPPIADILTLQNDTHTLSIGVPQGWEYSAVESSEGSDPYGFMSNISQTPPGETPFLVQAIIRPFEGLDVPFEVENINPALDYFTQFAIQKGRAGIGAYSEPAALRDGQIRAAVMLYVQENEDPRFADYEQVISLGFALPLEGEQMAIILMEAPAENSVDLLVLANLLIPTMALNGRLLAFDDLAQLLIGLESGESLTERYLTGQTVVNEGGAIPLLPLNAELLFLISNEVIIAPPLDWTVIEESDPLRAIFQSGDEKQTIEVWLSVLPQDYKDALEIMQAQAVNKETILFFEWDTLPAFAARLEDAEGALVIAELPRETGLLWAKFETELAEDDWQAWLNFLAQIYLNENQLGFNNIWGVMSQLQE